MSNILYLQRDRIDIEKWDHCITQADNGRIYGYSFYLDTMSRNWHALVLDDYSAVMPLCWNRKYGISYLYTPVFTSPLGIFGKQVSPELTETFLNHIPIHFKLWDLNLNTDIPVSVPGIKTNKRMNHVLSLKHDYENLSRQFRNSYRQLIKKGNDSGSQIKKHIPPEAIIDLCRKKMLHRTAVKAEDFDRFQKLFYVVQDKLECTTYGLYSKEGQLFASGIFFFSHDRAYYMLAGNSDQGRTGGASHQVIDAFIKDHSSRPLTLDFEGSDVPEIAFFFEGFGATKETYIHLHLNRLPFPLKFFKK